MVTVAAGGPKQPLLEIQDGGRRHLENTQTCVSRPCLDRFAPNFVCRYIVTFVGRLLRFRYLRIFVEFGAHADIAIRQRVQNHTFRKIQHSDDLDKIWRADRE